MDWQMDLSVVKRTLQSKRKMDICRLVSFCK